MKDSHDKVRGVYPEGFFVKIVFYDTQVQGHIFLSEVIQKKSARRKNYRTRLTFEIFSDTIPLYRLKTMRNTLPCVVMDVSINQIKDIEVL